MLILVHASRGIFLSFPLNHRHHEYCSLHTYSLGSGACFLVFASTYFGFSKVGGSFFLISYLPLASEKVAKNSVWVVVG